MIKPATRKFIVIPGILIVAIALAIAMSQFAPEPPKRENRKLDLLVEVYPLELSTEQFQVRSQGTVQPKTQTILSAEVSGTIVNMSPKFVAGGVFAANETLLKIDPSDYRVAVSRTEALVKQRQIEYEGAKKLRSQGYRAESEYASAAAALAAAEAEYESAKRNLERTSIRLPYEGIVLAKEAELGQYVNPGTRLGVTFATDVAEVRLPLTDQDLAFVDLPGAADVSATGSASGPMVRLTATRKGRPESWDAQVVRTEGVVDERSRVTYAVAEIRDPYRLHNDGTPIPVGTFVAAEIVGIESVAAIRIPRTALRGADQVLVVTDDDKIDIRAVDIAYTDQTFAYVTGGVAPGERITTTAIEAPTDGMSVRTADSPRNEDGDEPVVIAGDGEAD